MTETLGIGDLACDRCGDGIEDGYVPAVEADDGYDPTVDAAVCTACGFSEVGYAGCAPELGDLGVEADVLLQVTDAGEEYRVLGAKD